MIDAEGDYEGKYAAADRYIRTLRAAIGETFPLSLAGFPYVDYHPAFPYSVFLGPGGATYNQPQMYWKAIGTSVRAVYEHTYLYNRLWGHPIYPIGQTYEAPGNGPLKLFRRFAASYGGLAPSWWDWQETTGQEWGALGAASAARPVTGYRPNVDPPAAEAGQPRRHGRLGAGAPDRRPARKFPVTGVFGKLTDRRRPLLPGSPRPAGRRRDRHHHLAVPAQLRAVPDALVRDRRAPQRRRLGAAACGRRAGRSRPRCPPRPTR